MNTRPDLLLPDDLTEADRLLLGLSGELPPPDAAALANAVVADPALAGRRRAMASRLAAIDVALTHADAAWPLPAAFPAARAFGKAVRARAAAAPALVQSRPQWRSPWAIYPVAAAALLAVGMGAWWFNVHDDYDRPRVATSSPAEPATTLLAMRPGVSADPAGMTDDQIAAQFDSIVLDRDYRINRQIAVLDILQEALP